MPRIEVIASPELYSFRELTGSHVAVAVDILRATTTICAAFAAGVEEIVALESLEALTDYRQRGYQRIAERYGKRIGDAEWGNSPLLFRDAQLQGVRLAFSSTNGTVAILRASEAMQVFVGAFSNLSRLADHLSSISHDVVVVCSGWKGDISLEDLLFAGALTRKLSQSHTPSNDAATLSMRLWDAASRDPYAYCLDATHVRRLQGLGYDGDIRFALQPDTCPVLPFHTGDGVLRCL